MNNVLLLLIVVGVGFYMFNGKNIKKGSKSLQMSEVLSGSGVPKIVKDNKLLIGLALGFILCWLLGNGLVEGFDMGIVDEKVDNNFLPCCRGAIYDPNADPGCTGSELTINGQNPTDMGMSSDIIQTLGNTVCESINPNIVEQEYDDIINMCAKNGCCLRHIDDGGRINGPCLDDGTAVPNTEDSASFQSSHPNVESASLLKILSLDNDTRNELLNLALITRENIEFGLRGETRDAEDIIGAGAGVVDITGSQVSGRTVDCDHDGDLTFSALKATCLHNEDHTEACREECCGTTDYQSSPYSCAEQVGSLAGEICEGNSNWYQQHMGTFRNAQGWSMSPEDFNTFREDYLSSEIDNQPSICTKEQLNPK